MVFMNIAILLGKPFTNWKIGPKLSGKPLIVWEIQSHFSKQPYELKLAHSPIKLFSSRKDLQPVLRGYYLQLQDHNMVLKNIKR